MSIQDLRPRAQDLRGPPGGRTWEPRKLPRPARPGKPGAILILILYIAAGSSAQAADVGGANVVGMGDAEVAASTDNAAITGNPGVMGLAERYDFSGMVHFGPTGDIEWGAAIMDSHTTPAVAFGLAYVGGITDPQIPTDDLPGWKLPDDEISNLRHDNQFTVAGAVPLLDRRLSLGMSGTVLFFHRDITGTGTTGNMAFGAGFSPVPAFVLAAAGRDVLPIHSSASEEASLSLGARGIAEKFGLIESDVVWRPESGAVDVDAGLEARLGYARVRTGVRSLGQFDERQITWGLGVEGAAASFEYAMVIPVGSYFSGSALEHVVSLRVGAPDIDKEGEPVGF